MNRFTALIIFFISSCVLAQNPNYRNSSNSDDIYGKVYGIVKDSDDTKSLPYANISLFKVTNLSDTILVNGTISDEEGNFLFEKLTIDSYFVEVVTDNKQKIFNAIEDN